MLVKILQIVKLKRSATKPNVDFLVKVINENKSFLVSLCQTDYIYIYRALGPISLRASSTLLEKTISFSVTKSFSS